MAPVTYNLNSKQTSNEWTYGPQPVPVSNMEQGVGLGKFGLGVGAAALAGRVQVGNKRGFDYMIAAVRGIEEYSPGRVFRTFQVSHMMSGLETPSLAYRHITAEQISLMRYKGSHWVDHLARLTGVDAGQLSRTGVRFKDGKLYSGLTDKVLLERASVLRTISGADPKFQEGYARSLAKGNIPEKAFSKPIQYFDEFGNVQDDAFMFSGGKTRGQAAKRFLFGYGTSLVERINQLARAPFELPVISGIMNRVPLLNKMHLSVIPSSGLKTLGKITAKLGILGSATYLAYRELDYAARESSLLDNTIFGEGITAGLATAWTRGQVATSNIAETVGLHDYREWQEDIAPGSTELSRLLAFPILGAFAGLGYGYLSNIKRMAAYQSFGLDASTSSRALLAEEQLQRSVVYQKQARDLSKEFGDKTVQLINQQAEMRTSGRMGKIAKKFASVQKKSGLVSRIARTFGEVTPGRMRWIAGAGLGALLVAPFLPGALVPGERPDELEALYSGEKRVAIRKGRWWEFGRSPYEGKRVDRFQEHWYPRMLARSKEKAIWGESAPSPLEQWWIENFTYDLESKHYEERPYPITGTAFEDIPFVGPVLAATIGRFFKPAVLMHEEEWQSTNYLEQRIQETGDPEIDKHIGFGATKKMPRKFGQNVLPGELEPGSPVSPYSTKNVVGEQIYRMTEMVGLPGFTMTAIKEGITGRADTFDQEMQLESARRMYGAEREYWDQEFGGGLGTTELIRRLYPHRRRQIELYNPIRNKMPDWLPGEGERSPDFLHGDPYVKIVEGESRLPGVGYATLHPELEGVAAEDYPLMHKFAILADVGPYTDKFRSARIAVRQAIAANKLNEEEITKYKQIMEELKIRKTRREFSPYKWKDRARTPIEEILAQANEQAKTESDEPSWFERTIGSYWETLTHNAETPFEYLTPISPANKLIHMRTAVEDYEVNQVYGTENAFWGHPFRDFFGPTIDSAKHALGWDGIPDQLQDRREMEEYFDILKYVKYTRLRNEAQGEGDKSLATDYENKRRETLFGINPYTYNFSYIFRALPRRDRDYFNEFIEADMEERTKILKMIPENEQALMMARWKLKDSNDMKKAIKQGLLTDDQVQQAEVLLQDLFEEKSSEGMSKTKELWQEYIMTRLQGESYPDWYRRVKLLPEKLEGRPLPGPDWVGWHPSVDLEDIKLKIVAQEGKNMYDYDLWPDRQRAVARRPIIAEATEELEESDTNSEDIKSRINAVLAGNGIRTSQITLVPMLGSSETSVDLEVDEDVSMASREKIRRLMHG